MDARAYIDRPWWARVLQRTLLTTGYLLIAVAGYAAITQLDFPASYAGWAMIAGGVLAAIGALTRYYQIEAIALWPTIAGVAVCVVWLVLPPQNAVLTGYLVAAYIPPLAARLLVLNLLAARERRAVEA